MKVNVDYQLVSVESTDVDSILICRYYWRISKPASIELVLVGHTDFLPMWYVQAESDVLPASWYAPLKTSVYRIWEACDIDYGQAILQDNKLHETWHKGNSPHGLVFYRSDIKGGKGGSSEYELEYYPYNGSLVWHCAKYAPKIRDNFRKGGR